MGIAHLLPNIIQQFRDGNGNPLAGGTVTTYAGGTTTPLATWTDSTATVNNPNPLTLDANGSAAIWLDDEAYKVVVKDVHGNLIVSVDGVTNFGVGEITGAMIANGTITTTQLGAGAVETVNIAAAAVTTETIAENAVTNTQMAADSVATANIQPLAITNPLIAALAVDLSNINLTLYSQTFLANGSFVVPAGAATMFAAGCGGGSGVDGSGISLVLSTLMGTTIALGGAGGKAAPFIVAPFIPTAGTTLTVVVGSGGAHDSSGTATTITGTGVSIAMSGGTAGLNNYLGSGFGPPGDNSAYGAGGAGGGTNSVAPGGAAAANSGAGGGGVGLWDNSGAISGLVGGAGGSGQVTIFWVAP